MQFEEVRESFTRIGFNKQEVLTIWRLVSAILLLGNIGFNSSTLSDTQPCELIGSAAVNKVAQLLDIQVDRLRKCLQLRKRVVGMHVMESPLTLNDAIANRDSLARTLYDQIFAWIVKRLNLTLLPRSSSKIKLEEFSSIGLLDIFGFEVFLVNSFE